jgi:hypothetical protein
MKEIKLPSGNILRIVPAPFAVSKALYQAVLREMKGVALDSKMELSTLYKDLFCVGFSSREIEACLWECFKRCTYDCGKGDLKIDDSTFEPTETREDYLVICMEVAKENILPFGKSLFAEYQKALNEMEKGFPKSNS